MRSGQLMLAAPAGGDTWSNRVGGGEGLLAQPQLRHHAHRAHQPGAVHVLEGAQPPRLALAALRAGVPGLRRRAAGHGRPHAPRAARWGLRFRLIGFSRSWFAWAGVPGLRRRAAGHGGPHALRAAGYGLRVFMVTACLGGYALNRRRCKVWQRVCRSLCQHMLLLQKCPL